jgi:2-methylcitrate dehydratase PrpD
MKYDPYTTTAMPGRADRGGLTAELACRASSVDFGALPETVVERTRHVVLDWLGVTVAGAQEPVAGIVRTVARLEGGAPRATLVGTNDRLGPQAAALANGTAAHALDYDDSNLGMVGHPSAAVVSAVAAVAEAHEVDPEDALAGVVAGHEVAVRSGIALGVAHYLAGWHTTGTAGALGAAAGAARALGLDEEATARALGLAATQASGLRVAFGTMAKPFQAGRAAAAGVLAAELAAQGVSGATDAIEGAQGLAATQTTDFDPGRPERELGGRLAIEEAQFKFSACCGGAHGTINALEKLVADEPVPAHEVVDVDVRVSAQMRAVCGVIEPADALESKFSLPHVTALVLAGRPCDTTGFTEAAVADAALAALRARVRVGETGDETGHATTVTVRLRGGASRTERSDVRLPAPDAALERQKGRLTAKFHDLAGPVLGEFRAAGLADEIGALGRGGSLAELVASTRLGEHG